ncbi:MAG: hypothetical protein SA378_04135 [Sedimentibacter sp.]|uniref:hypothetical protein n=1 Tax=Sedimentibacter sp. TaxID=1960295 RepID=UPI00298280B1|nr:hypothetical protein [Sedimentibacter sp.]MDW5299312.1 hypothetical protein [Sedimentibacter sp.]
MKKLVKITMILLISSFSLAFANSGPVYWQGYPSSDIMTVDKDSPIEVKSENLIFDFSDENNDSYSVQANVTAEYEMTNPTDETQSVQMAFPYIERLSNVNYENIKITANGKEVPYEVYAGKTVNSYGNSFEENKDENFDFNEIVKTISKDTYEAENFKADEIGKLYSIEIKPTTDIGIDFTVDFTYDQEKTNIVIKNFNSFNREDEKVRIASGCFESQVAEIYVLGEDININKISGYTIGSSKEETNSFTYELIEKEVDVKSYLLGMKSYSYGDFEHISDVQLYNIYASALDKNFVNNLGFCMVDDVLEINSVRIITLVYTVEFLPAQDQKVSVSYSTKGTMDKRNTSSPQYLFYYILNSAKNWNSFNNLNIKIVTPQEAPYIIDSNIEFYKEEGNIYTASLEKLPEEDLSFTLYSKEKVTLYDKIEGRIYRSFGYFAPIVIGVIIIFIIIISIIVVRKSRKSN